MLIIPIVLGGLVAGATLKAIKHNKGVLTPDREKIYDNAMANLADPEKLRTLAKAYQEVGLEYESDMLTKRAALRELPEEIKEQRKEILQSALNSENKEGIASVATAFEKEGATGAAQRLREYLAGLM